MSESRKNWGLGFTVGILVGLLTASYLTLRSASRMQPAVVPLFRAKQGAEIDPTSRLRDLEASPTIH